ncbi:hypothetical protein POJ06DRAFT_10199 [Lipomyces tetrasporus]|uniref:Uncharacterized protein n=1 Tax=Lipomyces tetrasporus TaxID=54092 RepID=A0AAD7QYU8_9ASCO|nr:uncharacterized protein POJ06DRAFT_10199 [Lipomyces tetrasporus]KAJ8103970.1 hypothetical protein POJ06DRAFT_10199 [Lipomyces tetrasporus]
MCTRSRNSVLPLNVQKALDSVTRQLWLLASLGLRQDERFMPPLSGERYIAALQIVINNLHSLVGDAKLQIDEILPPSTTEGSQPKRFRAFVQSILGTIADGIDMDKLEKIVGDNMTNIMPNMVVLPFTHTNNTLREDGTEDNILSSFGLSDFGAELDEILGLTNSTSLGNTPPHNEALDLCETEVTASADTNEVLALGSDNQRSSCPPHESNLTPLSQQRVDHIEQAGNQQFRFRTYLCHSNRQSGTENFSDSAAEAIATGMPPFFGSTSESASPGSEPTSSLRLEIGSQVSYIARFTEEDMNSIINPSEPPERTHHPTPTPASEDLESLLSPVFVATERNARRLVPRRRRVVSRADQTYNYKMRQGAAFTWIGKVYGQGMAGRSDDLGRVTVITKYTKYFVLNTLSSSQFALANKVFENMLQLIILEKMKVEKGVEYLVKKGDLTVPNTFTTYLLNIQKVARKLASILQIEMVDPYQLDPFILTSDFGEAHGRYSDDGTSMGMLMECTVSRTTNDKILFSRRSPYIHFETCEGYSGQMFHLCPRVFEPFFIPDQVSWKLVPDLPWLVYDERQMQFLGIAPNFQQKTVLQTTLIATYMWHGVFREVQQPIELEIDLGQDADFGQLPGLLSVHHNIVNIDDANRETQRQVIAKQGETQISREPSDLHVTEVHQVDQSTEAIRCQINTVVAEIVPSYEETMSLSTQPIREFISNNDQSTARAIPNSDMRSASQVAGMGIDGNNSTVRTPTADDAISSDVTHIPQNTNHPPQPILSLNTSDIYDVSIVPMVAFEDKDDIASLDSLSGTK